MRAYLHDEVNAQRRQRLDAAAERHRLPGVSTPVRRVQQLIRRHDTTGDVAHKSDRRVRDGGTLQGGFHVIQSRLNQGAVEGLAGVQSPYPNLFRLESLHDGFHGGHRAADDLMRAVVRRDA